MAVVHPPSVTVPAVRPPVHANEPGPGQVAAGSGARRSSGQLTVALGQDARPRSGAPPAADALGPGGEAVPTAATPAPAAAGEPAAAREGEAGAEPRGLRRVEDATRLINRMLEEARRRLKFHVHEETGRIWVQVIDLDTQEVIKEIPPERYLDLVARIWELVGLLVDERA